MFQDWLTSKSPVWRHKMCGIADCSKKSIRRVTFSISNTIFFTLSQHVPVGSGLIWTPKIQSQKYWILGICFDHKFGGQKVPGSEHDAQEGISSADSSQLEDPDQSQLQDPSCPSFSPSEVKSFNQPNSTHSPHSDPAKLRRSGGYVDTSPGRDSSVLPSRSKRKNMDEENRLVF